MTVFVLCFFCSTSPLYSFVFLSLSLSLSLSTVLSLFLSLSLFPSLSFSPTLVLHSLPFFPQKSERKKTPLPPGHQNGESSAEENPPSASESAAEMVSSRLCTHCSTKKPSSGVKSIMPKNGGMIPRNTLRYGSVSCLSVSHGCLSQLNAGNHESSTRMNRKSR